MRKKSLLALLLALMLLMSGCALVTVDQEADNARIIVDVNGETVNKQRITSAVNAAISQNEYYNQLYAMFGMSANYPTDSATITPQVISAFVEQLVTMQKAKELGLDQYTEEEQAHIKEHTDEDWQDYLSQVAKAYFPDLNLEGEALEAEAMKYIEQNGLSHREVFEESATSEVLLEKLRAETVKDVTVSDDEIKALYDQKVAADQATYTENPNSYASAASGSQTVYYAPAGYRQVKQILIKLTDEDSSAVDAKKAELTSAQNMLSAAQTSLNDAAEDADKAPLQTAVDNAQKAVDEAQAAVDAATEAAFANIQAKVDEVYALVKAEGADFDALQKEYNQDSAGAPETYAINEGCTVYVEPFVTAGMALKEIGDVTEPVRTTYGYHILQYAGDVAEGPVALESVKDALNAEILSEKQDAAYDSAVAEWISAAQVKTYPEKMK